VECAPKKENYFHSKIFSKHPNEDRNSTMASTISDPDAVAATLEALQLSDESDLPNMYKEKIPERVRCYVPLRVGLSNIPGAGRGMFVEQDVVGGDRLFTISNPVFLVVCHRSKIFLDKTVLVYD
jgi:hypothetical protein